MSAPWLRRGPVLLLLMLLLAGAAFLAWRFLFSEVPDQPILGPASASQWPLAVPAISYSQLTAMSPAAPSSTYLQLRNSADPAARARAYRIWSTCSQRAAATAVAGRGPDTLLAAAPESTNRGQRQAALASIDALCRNLLGGAAVMANLGTDESAQLEFDAAHGRATSSALAIKLALDQGDRTQALALLQSALQVRDPETLVELALADVDLATDAGQQDAARLRRAALALLACDIDASRACDPASLMALKLCAFQERCSGPIDERLLPLLGFSEVELRASADRLRLLIGRNDNEIVEYLIGADLVK